MKGKGSYWWGLLLGCFIILYSLFRVGSAVYHSDIVFGILWLFIGLANAYSVYRILKVWPK